jgi:hypothetical protein
MLLIFCNGRPRFCGSFCDLAATRSVVPVRSEVRCRSAVRPFAARNRWGDKKQDRTIAAQRRVYRAETRYGKLGVDARPSCSIQIKRDPVVVPPF